MVHDLEEVLGIEAARTRRGQRRGHHHPALAPGDTADFVPERLRHPRRTLVIGVVALALVAGGIAFLATAPRRAPAAR